MGAAGPGSRWLEDNWRVSAGCRRRRRLLWLLPACHSPKSPTEEDSAAGLLPPLLLVVGLTACHQKMSPRGQRTKTRPLE